MQKKELQLISSLTLILWGLWVANPWFNCFTAAKVFSFMREIATEGIWGWGIFFIGVIQLFFLYTKRCESHMIMAFVSMLSFIVLALFYAIGNWKSTAFPIYLSFAVISFFGFIEALEFKKGCNYEK